MATAVLRTGLYLDQMAISDPGNASGFDGIRMIFSQGLSEVLIQFSGANFRTRKANLLCWNNGTVLECPDDDLDPPNEVWREPELVFLDTIFAAGGVTLGADLSDLRQKEIYLGFWYEYRTRKVIEDAIAEMVLEGLNLVQQRRALKYIWFGLGVDLVTAQSIANNRITNGVVPTYVELGLATVPLQDRRLLDLFGEQGWFE